MGLAYHCDRDGCETWQRHNADFPTSFVAVYDIYNDAEPIAHLCSLDCLMHWAAAHSAPTESRTL